jgi:hypothetical protein
MDPILSGYAPGTDKFVGWIVGWRLPADGAAPAIILHCGGQGDSLAC